MFISIRSRIDKHEQISKRSTCPLTLAHAHRHTRINRITDSTDRDTLLAGSGRHRYPLPLEFVVPCGQVQQLQQQQPVRAAGTRNNEACSIVGAFNTLPGSSQSGLASVAYSIYGTKCCTGVAGLRT